MELTKSDKSLLKTLFLICIPIFGWYVIADQINEEKLNGQ